VFVFNLAYFLEIIQQASEVKAADIVLSGNGFLYPATASLLATVAGINTWMPNAPGLGSLRGAAMCALRALGQPSPSLELTRVSVLNDATLFGALQRIPSAADAAIVIGFAAASYGRAARL
jgi:sugar (pentulose or hexulose) kinase